MSRFLPRDNNSPEALRKRRSEAVYRSLLEILLEDPIYRARYDEVRQALTSALMATEQALAVIASEIEQAIDTKEDLRGKAARLPDGTRVYRDAKGKIRREDGSIVDDTLAATIIWTGQEPGFEEMQAAENALAALQAQQDDLDAFQNNVLGPPQNQMSNQDDPPTLEELDQILTDIDQLMPDRVRFERESPQPTPAQPATTPKISIPTLTE
ncbi:MAG: hypothetical protein AAF583_13995 [Pseudomonadota bacterium]